MRSRQERHDAGTFDRLRQLALMPGTDAGPFGRQNFHVKINEAAQKTGILIIDISHLVRAEKTLFFFFGLVVIHKMMLIRK
jgi:hypothetical protein